MVLVGLVVGGCVISLLGSRLPEPFAGRRLVVLPAMLMAYCGQAAYLTKFPEHVSSIFYASGPTPIYWPTFIIANLAAVIANQAMISGTFPIISQSLNLSCFPRVKALPVSKVLLEERFLFRQIEPKEFCYMAYIPKRQMLEQSDMFRVYSCIVRYEYKETIEEPMEFKRQLAENLKKFIRRGSFLINEQTPEEVEQEIELVEKAKEQGVFYLIGEADVQARKDSSFFKRFVINNAYP
ncbi:UNVERIFIED_CONTAM: Potassium transporter 5 [Sesamum angustifolium]|uniref:Potassium transporter 5 n=1 Tax=Sesamum angustifolium TaxID=2727405 RepID=A0AAW2Q9L3_9LAMI